MSHAIIACACGFTWGWRQAWNTAISEPSQLRASYRMKLFMYVESLPCRRPEGLMRFRVRFPERVAK